MSRSNLKSAVSAIRRIYVEEISKRLEASNAAAGPKGRREIEKTAKEIAFGHLIRIALFKMSAKPADGERGAGPKKNGGGPSEYRAFLKNELPQMAKAVGEAWAGGGRSDGIGPGEDAVAFALEGLDGTLLDGEWSRGGEERLGRLHQLFFEPEKEALLDRLYGEKKKIGPDDLPAATRVYTPMWIAKWLVHNTLGRLWLEMHPGSEAARGLRYLERLPEGQREAPAKPLKEVRIIDPACGTMNFGLAAFDALVEMYREERRNAGRPGWPKHSETVDERDIPAAVIENNLHGADIDARAVGLAKLSLYLKAAALCPGPKAFAWNLLCLPPDGDESSGEARKELKLAGSLARLDGEGAGGSMKSFFRRRYDVVLCNPPYAGKKNIATELKDYLKKRYAGHDGDLYAAFMARCRELAEKSGRCGVVTVHTFMFTSSYGGLRRALTDEAALEAVCHLGARADFDVANKTAQGFVAFVSRNESNAQTRDETMTVWRRLGGASDREKKTLLEREIKSGGDAFRYVVRQEDLKLIPGAPWAYWMTDGIRGLFERFPSLSEIASPRQGLATTDNERFVRKWWELPEGSIERNARKSRKPPAGKWFPYMKGGDFNRWYGNLDHVLNWEADGREIKAAITEAYPYLKGKWRWVAKNSEWYFREGVTYTFLTVSDLNVRYLPPGYVFDVAGSSIFATGRRANPFALLAILNSPLAGFLLRALNPTVNCQVGDIGRLPAPPPEKNAKCYAQLARRARRCVELRKEMARGVETCPEFSAPPDWSRRLQNDIEAFCKLRKEEAAIEVLVYGLYGLNEEDRLAIEAERARKVGIEIAAASKPGEGLKSRVERLYLKKQTPSLIGEEAAPPKGHKSSQSRRGAQPRYLSFEEIGWLAGIGPERAARMALRYGWRRDEDDRELACRWFSYAVGIAMGRFRPGADGQTGVAVEDADRGAPRGRFSPDAELRALAVPNGIAMLEEGHACDLAVRVEKALELTLGRDGAAEVLACAGAGGDGPPAHRICRFLETAFFSNVHLLQYQKRPVYWLLQSPQKRVGVYLCWGRIGGSALELLLGGDYLGGLRDSLRAEMEGPEKRPGRSPEEGQKAPRRELKNRKAKLADLEAFLAGIESVLNGKDELGKTVGWRPEPDDGVLINMAPLRALVPGLSGDLNKRFERLQTGRLDWSRTAARCWPERVGRKRAASRSVELGRR